MKSEYINKETDFSKWNQDDDNENKLFSLST